MRTEETSLYQEIQRSASRNGAVLTMGSARDAEKQPLKFVMPSHFEQLGERFFAV